MTSRSRISWTDATWSPVTGCDPISAGCKNCYAKREVETRWSKNPRSVWYGRAFNDVQCHSDQLGVPLQWTKGRSIFVCPRADLFHEAVPDEFIWEVIKAMAKARQHLFLLLTKRVERMHRIMETFADRARGGKQAIPNVWPGASVENQETSDERVGPMRELASWGWSTWVSYEPALMPVEWAPWIEFIRWLVCGGESGPKARPMHPDWARAACEQAVRAGVWFHFKQWGEWCPVSQWEAVMLPRKRLGIFAISEASGLRFTEASSIDPDALERLIREAGERKDVQLMYRAGKKAARAILDGVQWREMPGVWPPELNGEPTEWSGPAACVGR